MIDLLKEARHYVAREQKMFSTVPPLLTPEFYLTGSEAGDREQFRVSSDLLARIDAAVAEAEADRYDEELAEEQFKAAVEETEDDDQEASEQPVD